jgi:hypothetical protein
MEAKIIKKITVFQFKIAFPMLYFFFQNENSYYLKQIRVQVQCIKTTSAGQASFVIRN